MQHKVAPKSGIQWNSIGFHWIPDFGATSQLRPGIASIEICTLMHDNVSNQGSGRPSTSPEKVDFPTPEAPRIAVTGLPESKA